VATVRDERLRVWQDQIETLVEVRGSGPPLVYLHGPWGLPTDRPFLDLLAGAHTVYAPRHPGTTPGEPDAIHRLDNWLDLVVYYGELLDRLGLPTTALVGHSFGGMVAAEIAATMPERVSRLALVAPLGLWRDDLPIKNWMILPDAERPRALFAAPDREAARQFFAVPDERDARAEAQASFIWAQACTGKFVWPIPDKGLKKHVHRIAAPTLILYGRQDGIVASDYAQEFASRIAGSRATVVDQAGHLPHLEQGEQVAGLVHDFLADGPRSG
jgi:pimeloyl-ACP methyl ester carboxylesterase